MIWDHLFDTYTPESPRYGFTTGFVSHNPVVLVFHGFREWWRGWKSAARWREAFNKK